MYKNILIPIDESALSMLVIERGVELARAFGARVTFLYLSPDAQDILKGDAGLLHAVAPGLFARKYLWADGYVEAKARGWARVAGVEANFVGGVASGRIHEEIVVAAQAQGADLIVIGSHGRASVLHKIFDSVTVKVILHSPLPVFVADTGVAPETTRSRLIACFRNEHAAWIALVDKLVEALRPEAATLDAGLVDDVLAFLERFGREMHGPKEGHLLAALNASAGSNTGLARIHAQHAEEPLRLAALRAAWGAHRQEGLAEVRTAAMALRVFIAEHLADENRMMLLRADDTLSDTDWERVGSEIFNTEWQEQSAARQHEFGRLFARFGTGDR